MEMIYKVLIILIPLILSATIHEFAHAWSAYKLGDDTAKRQGRLTLNPIAHIDPIGTIIFPIFLIVQDSGFFFAWAKPVPVSRLNFHRGITMKKGDILVSIAGPVSNLILAFIAAGALKIFSQSISVSSPLLFMFELMVFINISLAVFNMIPVPPLDGHYLLPDGIQEKLRQHQMYAFVGLIVFINVFRDALKHPILFFVNIIDYIWDFLLGGFLG